MAEINLTAAARDEFGKGAARRLRRAHQVPAVLYGHGTDPVHISLPAHDTLLALRQANALLNIKLPTGKDQLALPKQVQRNPVRDDIEHVDLIIVKRGEKVTVDVPLVLLGETASDTVVNQEHTSVSVLAEATHIPAQLELSIDGLDVGAQLTLADIALPDGVELTADPETLVLTVAATRAALVEETEGEEAEGETEGEGAAEAEPESEAE
jgi:large subunit ribosomal protein L25